MVFNGDQRARERERLLNEIEATRRRQLAAIARDSADTAERLNTAYQSTLEGLDDLLLRLEDPLNPLYIGANETDALYQWRDQLRDELDTFRDVMVDEAVSAEAAGVRAGVRVGVTNLIAGGVQAVFSQPVVENIQAAINITNSPAFQGIVNPYSQFHADRVADIIVAAVADGRNPREVALLVREYLEYSGTPLRDALRLTRTTQIYSFRHGTRQIYEDNGVQFWIWSANLGSDRTCMGCIAMHGTRHPVSEVLNDHHNGRCAMVPETPRWRDLGLSNGQDLQIESGVDWFNRQPDDVQRQIMGPQLFEAFQQGLVDFRPETIVTTYQNPLFGEMRRPRTNEDLFAMRTIPF